MQASRAGEGEGVDATRQPGRSRHRREALLVVGGLVGLLVLVVGALGVLALRAAERSTAGTGTALAAAQTYAAALRDGDADALRSAGGYDGEPRDGGPAPWPATLDDVVLRAQRQAAPVTDVTVAVEPVDDDAGSATARLRYAVAGQQVEQELELRRTGGVLAPLLGRWEVSAPLPRVLVNVPARNDGLRVSGTTVLQDELGGPDGRGVSVFPGLTDVVAEPAAGTAIAPWRGVLTGDQQQRVDLRVTLTEQGRRASEAAVARWLDGCAATDLANPGGCPLGVSEQPGETQRGARWDYDRSTWDSAQVAIAADGGIRATGLARAEYAVDVLVEQPDGTSRAEARAGGLERRWDAEVVIGLDGEAEVRL